MATNDTKKINTKGMSIFERHLTLWVTLCIIGGIVLGKLAPAFARTLDGMAIYVNKAPIVSIPIAVCLFFMMYPIMVKIDFTELLKAGVHAGRPLMEELTGHSWILDKVGKYMVLLPTQPMTFGLEGALVWTAGQPMWTIMMAALGQITRWTTGKK